MYSSTHRNRYRSIRGNHTAHKTSGAMTSAATGIADSGSHWSRSRRYWDFLGSWGFSL